MKIKGLLFGSAAALAMSGAASAADLPVAAVSSCAAGTLDIGGGVCLDISGYTRLNIEYQTETADNTRAVDWDADSRLQFVATTETELGTLVGTIRMDLGSIEAASRDEASAAFAHNGADPIDRATVQLGGFIAGYTTTLAGSFMNFDPMMSLTGDFPTEANMIGYTGSAGNFSYAIGIEENPASAWTTTDVLFGDGTTINPYYGNNGNLADLATDTNDTPAIAAAIGFSADMFSFSLGAHITSYDLESGATDDSITGYSVAGSFAVNPSDAVSVQMIASYGDGDASLVGDVGNDDWTQPWAVYDAVNNEWEGAEVWAISGSASFAATDTVTLMLGAAIDQGGDTEIGAQATWAPVDGFSVAAEVMMYELGTDEYANGSDRTDFLLRINRSF